MGILLELFNRLGSAHIKNYEESIELDTSVGDWVYNEKKREYDYIEKPVQDDPKYASLVYFDEEYIIIIDYEPFNEVEPIAVIDCEDEKEVNTVIKVLEAVFTPKANVFVEDIT